MTDQDRGEGGAPRPVRPPQRPVQRSRDPEPLEREGLLETFPDRGCSPSSGVTQARCGGARVT